MSDDDTGDLGPSMDEYVAALLNDGIFKPPSVEDEPAVDVWGWEIMEVTGPEKLTHHVVCVYDGIGRCSTPIDGFDPKRGIITTASGRIYRLMDREPSFSETRDREHVRAAWLRVAGLAPDAFKDVSEIYRAQLTPPQNQK